MFSFSPPSATTRRAPHSAVPRIGSLRHILLAPGSKHSWGCSALIRGKKCPSAALAKISWSFDGTRSVLAVDQEFCHLCSTFGEYSYLEVPDATKFSPDPVCRIPRPFSRPYKRKREALNLISIILLYRAQYDVF